MSQNENPLDVLKQVMAWYPNKTFYKVKSAKSAKELVSIYRPETFCPVYSHDEWNNDNYENPSFDFDFRKSFFEQFAGLQRISPVVALLSNMHENSEYCHDCEGLKNCYVVFDAINCRDIYYSNRIYNSSSCIDCYWVMDSELLYDSVYMFNSYNSRYSFDCRQVSDSYFLYDCRNVQNSFMCNGLRNASYCVYNKQLTEQKYNDFMQSINLADYAEILKLKKYFLEEIVAKNRANVPTIENCENVTGAYMKNSSNVQGGYESYNIKDGSNILQCSNAKDVVSSFMCNDRVELCFQSTATGIDAYNVRNCIFTWHSHNMEYCYLCINCQDCFGCIGLRNKKYHILNKEYSKEEYLELKAKIVEHMKNMNEYDKFFPMALSPFPYEDTIAYDFFDNYKIGVFYKEFEALSNYSVNNFGEINLITCPLSGKKFKYIKPELDFYKSKSIPLPKLCFELRYKQRMEIMYG